MSKDTAPEVGTDLVSKDSSPDVRIDPVSKDGWLDVRTDAVSKDCSTDVSTDSVSKDTMRAFRTGSVCQNSSTKGAPKQRGPKALRQHLLNQRSTNLARPQGSALNQAAWRPIFNANPAFQAHAEWAQGRNISSAGSELQISQCVACKCWAGLQALPTRPSMFTAR